MKHLKRRKQKQRFFQMLLADFTFDRFLSVNNWITYSKKLIFVLVSQLKEWRTVSYDSFTKFISLSAPRRKLIDFFFFFLYVIVVTELRARFSDQF